MVSLSPFDFFDLIPDDLKTKLRDMLVDQAVNQANKLKRQDIASKIRRLRSDTAFNEEFQRGLARAADRFFEEYEAQDEDLVAAIRGDTHFFQNEEMQKALLTMLRRPGSYLEDERDQVEMSLQSVLPSRKNRERVHRAVVYLLRCLVQELQHLPELQPIYTLQYQRLTADAARQQVELQRAQLQAQIQGDSGIRDALLQLTDAMLQQRLLLSAPPPPAQSKVRHNLPQPDYGQFIGREKELTDVIRILRPYPLSQHALVTIDGIGGIGKSALALEVAHYYLRNYDDLPPEERFDAIIWTSAKRTMLTGDGIVPRRQTLRTVDDIYSAVAATLQRDDIKRASAEDQTETVRSALVQQRTLLIVDNLETVDDPTVIAFLHELPAPTKAIITTRHRIDVAYPIRLAGMPWSDAKQLMAYECQKKAVSLSAEDSERLYLRTGGVPLAIVWSVAQIGFGHSSEAVLARLAYPASDIARFCFEGTVERVRNRPAYKLLMALSLFATDTNRVALGYITEIGELDRDEGLVDLEKLSLINKSGDRFSMLPLTQGYGRSELAGNPALEETYRNRWIEYLLNVVRESDQKTNESVRIAGPEAGNIFAAIDWCWRHRQLERIVEFVRKVDSYLWRAGDWALLSHYYDLGIEAAETLENLSAQANLLKLSSNIKDFQGQIHMAEAQARKAIGIFRAIKDNHGLMSSLFRLSSIQTSQKAFDAARESAEEGLRLAQEEDPNGIHVVRLRTRLGSIDITTGNDEAALAQLLQALVVNQALDPNRQESWTSAWLYRLLGIIELRRDRYQAADVHLVRALEIGQAIASQQDIAAAYQLIAEVALKLGQRDRAEDAARRAIEIFKKLGLHDEVAKTQSL